MSGFLRFAVQQITPGTPVSETAKAAAVKWKTMSDAEKRVFPLIWSVLIVALSTGG
jgi:hypothetical protein